jgi:hypothetical protein
MISSYGRSSIGAFFEPTSIDVYGSQCGTDWNRQMNLQRRRCFRERSARVRRISLPLETNPCYVIYCFILPVECTNFGMHLVHQEKIFALSPNLHLRLLSVTTRIFQDLERVSCHT